MEATSLKDAVELLRTRLPETPRVMGVLGSGLGFLAESVEDPVSIPFSEIPGFPVTGVAGHEGRYVAGRLEGCPVLIQSGRFHVYEGHSPAVIVAPVRIAAALGVEALLLTNAAGGVNRRFRPGTIVLLDDHLNLMWRSPLSGPVVEGEERFPDMSAPYDPELQRLAAEAAAEAGIELPRGTYAAVTGPSYETPAEVRMIERMGGDAVGMSTVPEVITARARGMRVVAFSLITNLAAGISPEPLSHDEVMEAGAEARPRFEALVRGLVRRIGGSAG
ncbi:MAG: purine-nucleoside phosphorylase [Gemmatimonadales bacterium]|nr:MAG: purine-nucleoside phosphorylase [Gemmatimonadales bacterium]